jgi:hypothetical protein
MSDIDVKDAVREKYSQAALRVRPAGSSCCGSTSARDPSNPITSNHYDASQPVPSLRKRCSLLLVVAIRQR